jgi:hypothetical protein
MRIVAVLAISVLLPACSHRMRGPAIGTGAAFTAIGIASMRGKDCGPVNDEVPGVPDLDHAGCSLGNAAAAAFGIALGLVGVGLLIGGLSADDAPPPPVPALAAPPVSTSDLVRPRARQVRLGFE